MNFLEELEQRLQDAQQQYDKACVEYNSSFKQVGHYKNMVEALRFLIARERENVQ